MRTDRFVKAAWDLFFAVFPIFLIVLVLTALLLMAHDIYEIFSLTRR